VSAAQSQPATCERDPRYIPALGLCCAGFICCNINNQNQCANDAVFNIVSWVTTKGWFDLPNHMGGTNDGAVLLVEPATESNILPDPLVTFTFNGPTYEVGSTIPPLDITTSGFPCPDARFEGCTAVNGLTEFCTERLGYTIPSASPLLDTNNIVGDVLVYTGSSCGGASGSPLSAPNNGVGGFGILIAGPTADCTLPGATSGSSYSQIVDKLQMNGVFVDSLAMALQGTRTRHAAPTKSSSKRQSRGRQSQRPN
jgi:hypothetical protein